MGFGFDKYDVNRLTARLDLPEISEDPVKPIVLLMRPASYDNAAFRSAVFKYESGADDGDPPKDEPPDQRARRLESKRSSNEELLAARMAGTVVVGWENVIEDGKHVSFSTEAATRFLLALMRQVNDVFVGKIMALANKPASEFRKVADPVELGKG